MVFVFNWVWCVLTVLCITMTQAPFGKIWYVNLSAVACLSISQFMFREKKPGLKKNHWKEFKTHLKEVKPVPHLIGSIFFALCFALIIYSMIHLGYTDVLWMQ